MGTRINDAVITDVVDGDTLRVLVGGEEEKLRIGSVDTEESNPGGSKPVTKMGIEAAAMAREFFRTADGGFASVDLEFDTDEDIESCFKRHRDNYGRLICYVHLGDEHYNLKLIREGWSPYFVKYGRSRQYHVRFTEAEAEAQAKNLHIWDPVSNKGGPSRDYTSLLPWWAWRAGIIEQFRELGAVTGALSVRLDYETILHAAETNRHITAFCDLQHGIARWPGDGALINAGSRTQPFNLWIPDARSEETASLVRLIEYRYEGHGRGYVYVQGKALMYRDTPEIVLTDVSQLRDIPA
jgi:micrococcal nuclease